MKDFLNLQKTLWDRADSLRSNSSLGPRDFAQPVLGVIFLKFADVQFRKTKAKLEKKQKEMESKRGRLRPISDKDYKAEGVVYLPKEARYGYLIGQPESTNKGKLLNDAMKKIEDKNTSLTT